MPPLIEYPEFMLDFHNTNFQSLPTPEQSIYPFESFFQNETYSYLIPTWFTITQECSIFNGSWQDIEASPLSVFAELKKHAHDDIDALVEGIGACAIDESNEGPKSMSVNTSETNSSRLQLKEIKRNAPYTHRRPSNKPSRGVGEQMMQRVGSIGRAPIAHSQRFCVEKPKRKRKRRLDVQCITCPNPACVCSLPGISFAQW